jgi:hypothetical protein
MLCLHSCLRASQFTSLSRLFTPFCRARMLFYCGFTLFDSPWYKTHARLRGLGKPPRVEYILSSDCSEVHPMLYIDLVFHRLTRILAFSNTFGGCSYSTHKPYTCVENHRLGSEEQVDLASFS